MEYIEGWDSKLGIIQIQKPGIQIVCEVQQGKAGDKEILQDIGNER